MPCHIEEAVTTSEENCKQCPNRFYKNGYCFVKGDCPAEAPLKTTHGCQSCDFAFAYTPTEEDCLVCPGRVYIDGQCILKEPK